MSRRMMRKHYAQAVIEKLQKLGYPADEAKAVFLRHYKWMYRYFGLEPNAEEFALIIHDSEKAAKRQGAIVRKRNLHRPTKVRIFHHTADGKETRDSTFFMNSLLRRAPR